MKTSFFLPWLLAAAVSATPALALTLYVAPEGNDAWSGRLEYPNAGRTDGPLATPAGAREALRHARQAGGVPEPTHIIFAEGEYALAEPLVLEPQDGGTALAPVVYEAAPGAHPLLSGGRRLTGWQVQPDGLWRLELPEVKAGQWYFEQLWLNGHRATRARTPNDGWLQAASAASEPVAGVKLAGPLDHTVIGMRPEDVASLQGLTPAELHDVNAQVYHSWNVSRHRLAGVDLEKGALQFTGPARWAFFQMEPYHRVQLENYRAALDAPGEWFLDRQGVLLYQPFPGEDPAHAETVVPITERWLELRGVPEKEEWVQHIAFQGLRFAYSRYTLPETGWNDSQADALMEAAIQADGARHLAFRQCEMTHTGAYALWFRHGCSDARVEQCHVHELGAGGIKIGETVVPKEAAGQTYGIAVENCIIQEGGRTFAGSVGVWAGHSGGNTIRHCDIGDFYYSAISLGWVWGFKPSLAVGNRVEWNHLHHLGWGVLSDMGAVYTLGPSAGTVIVHNRVHDIACYSYGGWGIYPDEGSTGLLIADNLVYHTQSGGFHQHYGAENLVVNNIFADAHEFQLRHSRSEDHLAVTFQRNLVLWHEGKLLGHLDAGWQGTQVKLDHNLYWREDGAPFDFAGKPWAAWQATGQDAGSRIADPLFVDAAKGDFHLQPGSPAAAIGFQPFDYTRAGVEGDPAWQALAAARPYLPMVFQDLKIEPAPLTFHEGFEFVKVADRMGPFRLTRAGQPDSIQIVSEEPRQGTHCLKLTDGPELKPAYNPHFFCIPRHRTGVSTFSFDVRVERDFDLVHEWRDAATPYHTGPQLRIAGGTLTAAGKPLLPVAPGEWLHIEIEAALDEAAGTWDLTVIRPGQPPQRFERLACVHPGWKTLEWLGFSSPGTKAASCWVDELVLRHQ